MKRIICLGSYQGADRVGWLMADALAGLEASGPAHAPALDIRRCASPAQIPSLFSGTTAVMLIDAVPQLAVGRVQRLQIDDLARDDAWSTHGLDLAGLLELIHALGDLPARFAILGIGVGACHADPEAIVVQALPEVLRAIHAL